jgi:hypothetical protein
MKQLIDIQAELKAPKNQFNSLFIWKLEDISLGLRYDRSLHDNKSSKCQICWELNKY